MLKHHQINEGTSRYLNPDDILLPPGYSIEVFADGLDTISNIVFTDEGEMIIADSGYITGNPYVARYVNGNFEIIANDFNVPLSGISYYRGNIYVSHRGVVTVIRSDGSRQDIIKGLPSFGDYSNSRVTFGLDGKMYFGQGTATNSGVVGTDNLWVPNHPHFHDNPGEYVMVVGQNFQTINMLVESGNELAYTGAFSPYTVTNMPFEVKKAVTRASGSILRANPDGTELEMVAWGFRNISHILFDEADRLFVANNGCDIRGSRPIANAPDEFHLIEPGIWYGWPDFVGGEPVTFPRFRPEGQPQPEFLLASHPNIPPRPYAVFPPGSTIRGFAFNYNENFGPVGDVYIAEFGSIRLGEIGGPIIVYPGTGHRISKIDMATGGVTTFAINRTGFPSYITQEGGFGRPADLAFGPDGAMYIVDMGSNTVSEANVFIPNSGVIWRVTRNTV